MARFTVELRRRVDLTRTRQIEAASAEEAVATVGSMPRGFVLSGVEGSEGAWEVEMCEGCGKPLLVGDEGPYVVTEDGSFCHPCVGSQPIATPDPSRSVEDPTEVQIDCWGHADEERLHADRGEAISAYVESCWPNVPDTMELCAFQRQKVDLEKCCDRPLEDLLEHLDEEFGDPDLGYTVPTEGMKAAARAFVAAVVAEYQVWQCEIVARETVNLRLWCEENGEEWPEKGAKG